jgi:NADH dehydrogenase
VLDYAMMLDFGIDAEALFRRFSAGLLASSLPGGGPFRVVIVGSGATGVELASYLVTDSLCAAIAPHSAAPEIQVTILEASDTFMPGVADEVREAVTHRLGKAGIEMKTGQQVNQISVDEVTTGDGNRFPADLAVWATGRVGPPVAGRIEALATNKKQQWIVRPTLQATASDAVFALGDCSYIEDNPVPPTAQAASEQAEHLARQLPQYLADAKPEPFEFKDKGTLLSLGEAGAIGSMRGFFSSDFQVRGRLARAAYRGLQRQHQYLLLGPVKGTAEVISDVFGRKVGPHLKVY